MSAWRRVSSDECTAGRVATSRVESVAIVTTRSMLVCKPKETTPTIVLTGSVRCEV